MVWLAVVAGGTVAMVRYSEVQGSARQAPERWPPASKLSRNGRRPTLLMFLHPRCPCSRASVGELECLLAKVHGRMDVCVVFIMPPRAGDEWERSDLVRKVQSLQEVRPYIDKNGTEARCFGAETSGQTLLYDANGVLRFSGGITAGRGHAGDNPGRSALEDLMLGAEPNSGNTPVFGCALFETKCPAGEILCKP